MLRDAIEIIRDADGSLDIYARHYASSEPFQKHFQEVLSMVRAHARHSFKDPSQIRERNLLFAFADSLELANKGQAYVPMDERKD